MRSVKLPFPDLARQDHGHISAADIQPHLTREVWNSYFKFAFVRNPFDRFISAMAFFRPQLFKANAKACIQEVLFAQKKGRHFLFLPQEHWMKDQAHQFSMDFVGKYENLSLDFDKIMHHIGLPATSLQPQNSASHAPYAQYYDAELTTLVQQLYQHDFKAFNYPTEIAV